MRLTLMLGMMLGLAAVVAQGAPVWQENFDSYTTWPAGGWERGNNGDLSMGFDHTTGSANCLMLTKEPSVSEPWAYHTFDSTAQGTATAWVRQTIDSTPGSGGGLRFVIANVATNKDIGYICLTEDKYVTLNTTNGYDTARRLGTYDPGTWYQISLSWDASTETVTASFNGGAPVSDSYKQSGAGNADQLLGYISNTVSTTFSGYVDDIVVTPEPTTLGLLAMGGLALVRRRKA
ncbi:MAG: PEP-CTERM sorting domain-containing protein [Phycisphaerae bacterium]|nr:PEP-CTERM sorting domain-containing protein [Phycisphaerae bacterium]